MRFVGVLFILSAAACGGGSNACPSERGLYCDEAGRTCEDEDEGGLPYYCTCNGASWTCNNCPDGARPIGACEVPGEACGVSGFENSCACTCDAATGEWRCTSDDPSPNFHCSP